MRRVVASLLAGLVMVGLGSSSAGALSPDPIQQVTLVLTPPDRAGLHALSTSHGGKRGDRTRRLAALTPSEQRRQMVSSVLASAGLQVTGGTAWTMRARGPAHAIAALFGSARSAHQSSAAAQALPRVPADLRNLVTVAAGGDETRKRYRPRATTDTGEGPWLRDAYVSPGDGTAPSGRGGQTVATLQFSGWDRRDLTTYAASIGVPDPVARGQYSEVAIGTANPRKVDGSGGESEVALDQEALLAVAPKLNQRAYFIDQSSGNVVAGELDALGQVIDDALDASHNYYHLVALSTSWGQCEAQAYPGDSYAPGTASDLTAEVDMYSAVVAAGVTVFASSGDSGAFDCSTPGTVDNTAAVDTPASFPAVVAVGGTRLDPGAGSLGSTYTDTVWAEPTSSGPAYAGGGGGGGRSKLAGLSRPSYQQGLTIAGTDRLVPDIALEADPQPGFTVYSSTGGGWMIGVGGTSLAAPVAAAGFAETLAHSGYTTGIGDIHGYLYNNPVYAGSGQTLRDVTSGDNSFGRIAEQVAGVGFDLSSGLGAPIWSGLEARFRQELQLSSAHPAQLGYTFPVSVAQPAGGLAPDWRWASGWSASKPAPGDPIPTCDPQAMTTTAPTSISVAASGPSGYRTLYVAALNPAGNCFIAKTRVLHDTIGPTTTMVSATRASRTTTAFTTKWTSTDPAPGVGVKDWLVSVTRAGASAPEWSKVVSVPSLTYTGQPGVAYQVSVVARDGLGNAGAPAAMGFQLQKDDRSFSWSPGWRSESDAADYAGSDTWSDTAGASATLVASGRSFSVVVTAGPDGGRVAVFLDGRSYGVVDTWASTLQHGALVHIVDLPNAGQHMMRVQVTGTHRSGASGSKVRVDGLLIG